MDDDAATYEDGGSSDAQDDAGEGGGAYTDEMTFGDVAHGVGAVASGVGGALYHAAGSVYHDAQADVSWLEGDHAAMDQHLEESQQSIDDAAADLQPGVDYVEGVVHDLVD